MLVSERFILCKSSCLEHEQSGIALKICVAVLVVWKDADPDIPILKQAKAEYAKLQ